MNFCCSHKFTIISGMRRAFSLSTNVHVQKLERIKVLGKFRDVQGWSQKFFDREGADSSDGGS